MSGHTPGPWTSTCVPTSIGHAHKIEPIRACIYVDYRDARQTDAKTALAAADARLIAASPELLDEAKALLDEIREHGTHQCWKGLAAAVTKAEGVS